MRGLLRSRLFWAAVLVLAVAAVLPLGVSGYVLGLLTLAYYFGVFAMAWDLLFGFAGEVNFGPTFLVGLGAYGAGILNSEAGLPIPVCVLFGAVLAVAGGLLLAVPALRLSGPYFGLITLVAVLLLQQMVTVFAQYSGGEIGLTIPDVMSIDETTNYYIALGFMAFSGLVLFGLSRSALGLILQACGQDPIEAQALGFNVAKHKLAAFCVSALFSGLAGAMLVFYLGTASPGTVIDIAVGAVVLIVAGEVLRPLGQLSTFIVSAVALLAILLVPSGLLGVLMRQRQ